MKEVVFTIDDATGALTVRVNGVPGQACAPIATMVEGLLGVAATHENTTEWYTGAYVRGVPSATIKPKGG